MHDLHWILAMLLANGGAYDTLQHMHQSKWQAALASRDCSPLRSLAALPSSIGIDREVIDRVFKRIQQSQPVVDREQFNG
jgi:hypothetical protein